MRKERVGERLASVFFSAFFAAEITVVADAVSALLGHSLSLPVYLVIWLAAGIAIQICPLLSLKRKRWISLISLAAILPVMLAGFCCWLAFSKNAVYTEVDDGKASMFAEKKGMLIVPHEDDDINVLGGVMDEYIKYGSELYVVFVTNGDYEGLGEIRIGEAIAYCGRVGIPEDHVIFLGYGDQWADGGPHLYNAEPGAVLRSFVGYKATYGTEAHPAYHNGNSYTVENLKADLESVILEYKPDILFCSDYDSHIDHKATTLMFEKVMGDILRSNSDYRPEVFKGFAYSTAWYSEEDFYEMNILSTQNIYENPYPQEPGVYRWQDRVRLPVSASTLSRSLMTTDAYEGMRIYASQKMAFHALQIANGDKVFWQRSTESMCYTAEISVSSGSGAVLNDFMLLENNNLTDTERMPYDGVWIPEEADEQPTVTVKFPEKTELFSIVLYDHPAKDRNVLNAVIRFDDGTEIETGALDPAGAASEFIVEKTGVGAFEVILTASEGTGAGLTEIEAFARQTVKNGKLIKIMDADENFVYDYCIDSSGRQEFFLYAYGDVPEINAENYAVSCTNEKCRAALKDGKLIVECPTGETCVVRISCESEDLSDSIFLQNPGALQRGWMERMQTLEDRSYYLLRTMVTCRAVRKVIDLFGYTIS